MDYQKHYNNLINRAKHRLLEGYTENHHIIPRCIGGSNDSTNLVALTPEEHYVAHQLLVKIYPDEPKLVYAAHMMGNTRKGNKSYGWLRKRLSESMKGKDAWNKGKITPEEIRQKQSNSMKGKNKGNTYGEKNKNRIPWNKGIPCTEECRKNISDAKKGKLLPEETKQRMSISQKERWAARRVSK